MERGWTAYNSCVSFWADPRILGPKCIDDSPQRQVDATSHECRSNCETHNLDQESVLVPLILMGLDSTCIAYDLEDNAGQQSKVESKCSACECIGCEEPD